MSAASFEALPESVRVLAQADFGQVAGLFRDTVDPARVSPRWRYRIWLAASLAALAMSRSTDSAWDICCLWREDDLGGAEDFLSAQPVGTALQGPPADEVYFSAKKPAIPG